MQGKTLLALGLVAGAFLLARRGAVSASGLSIFGPINKNQNIPTPAESAAYWSLQAGGPPSEAGTSGGSVVTPTAILIPGVSSAFPGTAPYVPPGPGAGRGAPASPQGARTYGGSVFPPASAQPQSPVQSTSPWTPTRLYLRAPLAANAWLYPLSGVDPRVAFYAGSGGYLDIVPSERLREVL